MPPVSSIPDKTLKPNSPAKWIGNTTLNGIPTEDSEKALLEATKEALKLQGVTVPPKCEQFISRCIRVKHYDVQKAATLIKNFGEMMRMPEMQSVFSHLRPSLVRGLYEKKIIYALEKRGPNGEVIIVSQAGNWNPSEFNTDQALAALVVLYNFCVANSIQVQHDGIILLGDFGGFSVKMLKAFNFTHVRLVIKLLQSCTTAKIKAFHFINYPRIVKGVYTMLKPLFKSKMLDRVHFHGDGTTSLREELEFLPESLGGVVKEDGIDWQFLELLYQQEQYYQDLLKFSYPPY